MRKLRFVAALAAVLGVTDAAAQSLVLRSDWQDRTFETYLPRINTSVPWLEIAPKTKLPRGDMPIGRHVASVGRFVLHPRQDVQVSTNVPSNHGSM